MTTDRIFITLGGLAGAAGVALSAMAAHAGGGNLGTAATFLLAHAPVLLAIGLFDARRPLAIAAAILALGVLLFCGDLVVRDLAGTRLFAMAAPAGGTLMIVGWLAIAAAGLAGYGRPPRD